MIWDSQIHDNLLKMLSSYYVPIKIIDSPYSPLGFDVNSAEIDDTFHQILNIIVKEVELGQQHGNY